LIAYKNSFEADEFNSLPPNPPYCKNFSAQEEQKQFYDLRYHLLLLFSKRSHPLEELLNPATHTPDPLDYRLRCLKSFS